MLRALRYTRIALLIFGSGMIAGLIVVAGEFSAWQRPAAGLMALGLVLIPLGLFADGHGMTLIGWVIARLRRHKPRKGRAKRASPARRRKPARSTGRAAARSRSR
jgi:hypothetical protein